MYLQITDRCNFSCEHCCMAATEHGMDMSRATFLAACKLAEDRGDCILLGGGEPTLHPKFWEFIGLALAHTSRHVEDTIVWLATNGSQTELAIRLAGMARGGVLGVCLSLDEWHDPIDYEVEEAFTSGMRHNGSYWEQKPVGLGHIYNDLREIRTIQHDNVIPVGRAKDWGEGDEKCACPELFATPQGALYSCGCKKEKLGTIKKPSIPDTFMPGECYRDQELAAV